MKDDKSNEIVYTSVIYLNNIKELRKHLKTLNKKYGKGNVPLEEAMKFNFDIRFRPIRKIHSS